MAANLDDAAARFQSEYAALLQLTQVLREHLAALPHINPGPWLDGLRTAFDRLHAHVERWYAMKEKDGYLDAVVKERPMLTRQVASIAAENGQLLRLAGAIRRELAEIRPADRLLIDEACARIQRFMTTLAQHEQRENVIAIFAFNQDLGAF